ncbi:cytochrome P450 [Setomelanomma holmii]|uniref:Cytochrome P450 n=1 Tax=Setomelanomma holmii TaxID=210430 RepID=A0A9P4H7R9_9PLEO|nr:cytochrome P450 [Setomelanomma holmii]
MALDTFLVSTGLAVVVYCLSRAVHNLCFHSLAGFPGPWWAAASYWVEFYYDVIKGGRYFSVIAQMHDKYGPLVRINPNDLHLNDPYFYEQLYSGSSQKRNKDKDFAAILGVKFALNVTLDHQLHRERRGYISSLFSKQSTQRMEPFIRGRIDKLVGRFRQAHRDGEAIEGVQAFGALTTDIITRYAYGESFDELERPGYPCPLIRNVKGLLQSAHFRRFLPVVASLVEKLPERWMRRLVPTLGSYLDFQDKIMQFSIQAHERNQTQAAANKQRTIFDALTGPNVPPEEKTLERLKDESILVLTAGLETTAHFLTAMVCYMVTCPGVLSKLRAELQSLGTSPGQQLTWSQLEALPYLTPVGAMPWLLNRHPDIFPDPDVFRPERWLEAER